ncbi:MAG TPA: hypothetical protein V6D08_06720 [Candidatus Obscuribacterales bacterium]
MASSGPETSPGGEESEYKPGIEKPAGSSDSRAEPAAATAGAPDKAENSAAAAGGDSAQTAESGEAAQPAEIHPHHVSKILDEVLQEPEPAPAARRFRHPMILDVVLAIGLLVAMGGFTIGLFKMYLTHSAEQSITQNNYKAAIAILKGAPLPGFFSIPGSDPDELLAQALYLDAMDKIDQDNDIDGAIKELQQIKPGSRYFALAQKIIEEHHTPSPLFLQGGTEHVETNPQPAPEKKPILPELPPDGSQ